MSIALEIRRLSQRDVLGDFSAGLDADATKLNEFLRQYAKQNEKRQMSATSIAWAGDAPAGFVTIVPGAVNPALIADHVKGLSRHSAPVLVLARMATDERFKGQGVGRRLMRDVVFARAMALADDCGCVGVYVDPKPGAVTFYQKLEFITLAGPPEATAPPPMFLALKTIRAAAARASG